MISPGKYVVALAGLRARLLLTFVLLGAITSIAVAGVLYAQARETILRTAQDHAASQLKRDVSALVTVPRLPPTQADVDRIARQLASRDTSISVRYQQLASRPVPGTDLPVIPTYMRPAVTSGAMTWKRSSDRGNPFVVVSTKVSVLLPNGQAYNTDLEIYSARQLHAEQQTIDQLALRAGLTGGASLIIAVLLALLAARGVLRPVRELGAAAHQLGTGELATRVPVRGSDELSSVAETFNHMAGELERYVSELRRLEADARRFVADVSHELRTPLTAMTAVTDVLDEEAPHLPTDARQAAHLISGETRALTRLVNDLIEVSGFDSGTAALAIDDVDIASAIHATLRARAWTDIVETDLRPRIIASVDPRRLDVIVANLVGNGLKHGEPPVTIRLRGDQSWFTIEVTDHGGGLDPDVLPRVFDRFYKADSARARSEGSGLGLAIARENARLHRGDLTAANSPGGGARFTARIPINPSISGTPQTSGTPAAP